MVQNAVENYVVTVLTFGEIFLAVVNDLIRADGSDHIHIPRTAHASNLCAERLGDLHSERTHASRRTVNQDPLSRLNVSLVAKTLQRGECRHAYRSRLLKCHIIWLHGQCRLGSARIFGEGPTARAEHLVAWFELRYTPA